MRKSCWLESRSSAFISPRPSRPTLCMPGGGLCSTSGTGKGSAGGSSMLLTLPQDSMSHAIEHQLWPPSQLPSGQLRDGLLPRCQYTRGF